MVSERTSVGGPNNGITKRGHEDQNRNPIR